MDNSFIHKEDDLIHLMLKKNGYYKDIKRIFYCQSITLIGFVFEAGFVN